MTDWPAIEEPELLERLALADDEFGEFVARLAASIPARPYDQAALDVALGYPWPRPPGAFELRDGEARPLAEMRAAERDEAIRRGTGGEEPRLPLLAIGSNAAPEALERKFAHFERPADRELLVVSGHLHGFDVGVAPQPTLYGSLPATLFPGPGTEVATAVLWVTATQFTQLTWTELSYRLGRLHTPFTAEELDLRFDDVLVFVSRFGAFAPDGDPLALAAVPARHRTAEPLTQQALLDRAARIALGDEADAETLVRATCEDMGALSALTRERLWRHSQPFESEAWEPFPTASAIEKR
jgi:hypothetical protein